MTIPKITVILENRRRGRAEWKELELEAGSDLNSILPLTGLSSFEEYHVVIGGQIRTGTYVLNDGDHIKIFTPVVGG